MAVPVRTDLRLRVVDEAQTFAPLIDVADLRLPAQSGAWLDCEPSAPPPVYSDDFTTRLRGEAAPSPEQVLGLVPRGPTRLFRLDDALVLPRLGIVIGSDGVVCRCASGEALHRWPDMRGWPGVESAAGEAVLRLEATPNVIERASLFMPWGAGFNYGHFLIDGLCGLLAVEEAGLIREFPPVAGPMRKWQRQAIAIAFNQTPPPLVQPVKAVRVSRLLYTGCMDHFLHAPNGLLGRLAERFRAAQPPAKPRKRRVYLSRRGLSMRVMINEAALEHALRARGFEIVHPERLSFAAQLRLMGETDLLVGATGAGLANALLLSEGAKVVEIQPANFTSQWLYSLSREAGVDWFGYYCQSPAPDAKAPWTARMRRGFRFGYHLPLADFLQVLDGVR